MRSARQAGCDESTQKGSGRFVFATLSNCSASALVNLMGTILPFASPLGSFGLPGLRFTGCSLLLVYYNN
jgi:hypothetical protein